MSFLSWDEGVFSSSKWLYDLHIVAHGEGVIHIPLLYLTKLRIQQELYCSALNEFPALMALNAIFQPTIVDGAVVKIPLNTFETFRVKCYENVSGDRELQKYFIRQLLVIKKWLPLICLSTEKQFLTTGKPSQTLMKRLFRILNRSFAISLLNPFAEIVFVKANQMYQNDPAFKELLKKVVWAKAFSHMPYFEDKLNYIKQQASNGSLSEEELLNFCWHIAFLENPIGDGSNIENPQTLARSLNQHQLAESLKNVTIKEDQLSLPDINFDPSGLTDTLQNYQSPLEQFLILLRFLQINEEFRHYWGIRIIRLFRLVAPDEEAQMSWSLSDYEQYLKKQ